MRHITRPRYADVAATLALVVAMGGTAYAALPKNSVGAKQLKDNAVRSAEVRNGTVTAADLAGGSVGAGQLQAGSVGAGHLAAGAVSGATIADDTVGVGDLRGGDAVVALPNLTVPVDECANTTVTVPGALPGQVVLLTADAAAGSFATSLQPARVSAPDTVMITFCNNDPDGPITTSRKLRVVTIG